MNTQRVDGYKAPVGVSIDDDVDSDALKVAKAASPTGVYTWDGPPTIELVSQTITWRGATWLHHILTMQGGLPGVVVIARHPDGIIVERHYRPAIDALGWEFPRGCGDPEDFCDVTEAEGALVAARRELQEETGWVLENAEVVGTFHPDSGIENLTMYVVAGDVAGRDESILDEMEKTDLFTFSTDEIGSMITRGEMRDGMTLAAWALYQGR
ncbi:MAG: NUDIX hydrolase [Cellulomonadaceae bacterium]|nr:NUDIX hydrolase [Cellulomonadaceae bacterium]